MTLLELAERCGANNADEWPLIREAGLRVFGPGHKAFRRIQRLCDEKAFLDAAMSLVPEGCLYVTRTVWDGDETAGFASVSRYEQGKFGDHPRRYWIDEHQATATTAPLALTAACLRARATLPEGEER